MTHTYIARAHLEGNGPWWTIEVPELTSPGPDGKTIVATGGAVSTRGLEKAARELVAVWLDVPETDVKVSVEVEIPEDVARMWDEGGAVEVEGRAAIERGAAMRREAVRRLREQGYTEEAAAAGLKISRQRVQQLTKAS